MVIRLFANNCIVVRSTIFKNPFHTMSQAQICGLITTFSHTREGSIRLLFVFHQEFSPISFPPLPFLVLLYDSDAAFGIWVPAMLVIDIHDFSFRFRRGLTVGVLVTPCYIGKIPQQDLNH